MSRKPTVLPNLIAAACLVAAPVALAQQAQPQQPPQRERAPYRDQNGGQNREQPRPRGSLSDAVRRAERDTRGEVLSAERIQYDGRDMHRVKVVDDQGRVRVFMQEPARASDNSGKRQQQGTRDRDD